MTDITSPNLVKVEKAESSKFFLDRVLTIFGAHFIHDTYSSFLAPLLPILIDKLSLSYTQAGSLSAIAQIPSLVNPLIGYLDDKVNLRIFVILAPAITATTMSCLGLAPNYASLVILLFITGLSIAGFHSLAPTLIARASGKELGRGMSFLMAGGELGRTVGPLLASWGLLTFTIGGMFPIAIPGWIASLMIFLRFKNIPVHVEKQTAFLSILPTARKLFLPLIGIACFRSFLTTGIGVYLPTFLEREGASIWKAGYTLAIYQLAGVVGAFLGGTISDRFGRKPVLFTTTFLAPIMLIAFLNATGWVIIPVLIFAGLLGLSSQPILLAIVQDQFPNHRSISNGFFTAMNFIFLSAAAVIIGMLGDHFGLRQAFFWTAIAGLISSPLAWLLPKSPSLNIKTSHPQQEQ